MAVTPKGFFTHTGFGRPALWVFLAAFIQAVVTPDPAQALPEDAYVYYSDKDTVSYVPATGGASKKILTLSGGDITALSLDSQNDKVYVAHTGNSGQIFRAELDGSNLTTVATGLSDSFRGMGLQMYGMALDVPNSTIYFTIYGGNQTVHRVNFDGTGLTKLPIYVGGVTFGVDLDLFNSKIYYVAYGMGDVMRANLDGTGREKVADGAAWSFAWVTVSPSEGKIYLSDRESGVVSRANLDGSNASAIMTGLQGPSEVGVHAASGKIFLAAGGPYRIIRANLNGTSPETILLTGTVYLSALDVASGLDFPTATPTPLPTATPTVTPTATNSPTPTASPEVMPTGTATPAPTFTETAMPVATSAASPSPAASASPVVSPSPVATPSPTRTTPATPTVIPSPYPTLTDSQISGRVVSENGGPQPGVVVYLYRQSSAESRTVVPGMPGDEVGALNSVTDADGRYYFEQLAAGTYRIRPNMTGFSFRPEAVSVDTGSTASPIEAVAVDMHDDGCVKVVRTTDILDADARTKSVYKFAENRIAAYRASAGGRLKEDRLAALERSLLSAEANLARSYTSTLRESASMPKITLSCRGKAGCAETDYSTTVRRYISELAKLRRLTLFVMRRADDTLARTASSSSRLVAKAKALHRAAAAAVGRLPEKTDRCER